MLSQEESGPEFIGAVLTDIHTRHPDVPISTLFGGARSVNDKRMYARWLTSHRETDNCCLQSQIEAGLSGDYVSVLTKGACSTETVDALKPEAFRISLAFDSRALHLPEQ